MNERIKKNYRCLMIRTPEKKKFFTHEENYTPLIEFSRMFRAEISVVRVREAEVLDLQELVPALCDNNYQPHLSNYRVLGRKLKTKPARISTRQNAKLVRDFIRDTLLKGRELSLKTLVERFGELGLSTTSLANQFRKVRQQLGDLSYSLDRDKGGCYRVLTGVGG